MSKSLDDWLNEYGESHQNKTNKLIHWVCVPGIFLTVVGFLWAAPTPMAWEGYGWLNWATLILALVALFYCRLSLSIALGVIGFSLGCMGIVAWYDQAGLWGLWQTCGVLFVGFWILQFIGHSIEGKKPSFLQDIQFLLIGPAWVLAFIYRKVGLRY